MAVVDDGAHRFFVHRAAGQQLLALEQAAQVGTVFPSSGRIVAAHTIGLKGDRLGGPRRLRRLALEREEEGHQIVSLFRRQIIAEGGHAIVSVENDFADVLFGGASAIPQSHLTEQRTERRAHFPLIVFNVVTARARNEQSLASARISGARDNPPCRRRERSMGRSLSVSRGE